MTTEQEQPIERHGPVRIPITFPDPPQTTPESAASDPDSKCGRPRSLDPKKRGVIFSLVAQGYGLARAARYVGCSVKTVRRDAERIPEFGERLRQALLSCRLSPLQNLRDAAGTDWRAAAWILERTDPDRFARRNPAALDAKQLRHLLHEVLEIIDNEVIDPNQHGRIENRLRATFEYRCRVVCDRRRNKGDLRQAVEFFERKAEFNNPLTAFAPPGPDFKAIGSCPVITEKPPAGSKASLPGPSSNRESTQADATLSHLTRMLSDALQESGRPSSPGDALESVAALTNNVPERDTNGQKGTKPT